MTTYTAIEPPRIYPTFRFRNAATMIDWLRDAFGFTVKARYEDDKGVVGHAELALGSSIIMSARRRKTNTAPLSASPAIRAASRSM